MEDLAAKCLEQSTSPILVAALAPMSTVEAQQSQLPMCRPAYDFRHEL